MAYDHEQALADGAACLEAALEYLVRGWAPLPLCPPDHAGVGKEHARKCASKGKGPLVAGWTGELFQPSEADLRSWWHAWPNANVGIVMGRASGLVGIDIDNEKGLALFLKAAGGVLLPTLEFRTPGGGVRYLFEAVGSEEIKIARETFGKHDEFRLLGQGSQTVAPPSRHANGGYYEWHPSSGVSITRP